LEFSYNITEAEYRRFCRLRDRSFVTILIKLIRNMVLFWILIFTCVVLLWVAVSAGSHTEKLEAHTTAQTTTQPSSTSATAPASKLQQILIFGVFLAILGASVFALFISPGLQIKRRYRKDPLMQGRFSVIALPNSVSITNTSGFSSQTDWTLYRSWRETKGLIVLRMKTDLDVAISIAGLSEQQRAELRGILAAALPRK
jgi:hypothetical protein